MLLGFYKWRCSHTLMSLPAVTAQLRRSGPQGDLSLSVRCLLPARLLSRRRSQAWQPSPFWTCVGKWSPTWAPAAWANTCRLICRRDGTQVDSRGWPSSSAETVGVVATVTAGERKCVTSPLRKPIYGTTFKMQWMCFYGSSALYVFVSDTVHWAVWTTEVSNTGSI